MPVPKAGGAKATSAGCSGGSPLGLWLRLLVNLSFAEDGQQSILRVTGALELLADLAQHRRHALLTLHNLCFCPANKSHIIANGMEEKEGLKFSSSYRDVKILKEQLEKGISTGENEKKICIYECCFHSVSS